MMRNSIQARDIGHEFLTFAKNMSKTLGKNISKNLSGKYSQKLVVHAKQSATDEPKILKSNSKNSRSNW